MIGFVQYGKSNSCIFYYAENNFESLDRPNDI